MVGTITSNFAWEVQRSVTKFQKAFPVCIRIMCLPHLLFYPRMVLLPVGLHDGEFVEGAGITKLTIWNYLRSLKIVRKEVIGLYSDEIWLFSEYLKHCRVDEERVSTEDKIKTSGWKETCFSLPWNFSEQVEPAYSVKAALWSAELSSLGDLKANHRML